MIIYHYEHHENNEKIAKTMIDAVKTKLVKSNNSNLNSANKIIDNYDVIGFGSGIYSDKHHKSLIDLVSVLPEKYT